MKILFKILVWAIAICLGIFSCYLMVLEAKAVSNVTMEKINEVQMMYDQAIEKYEQGSHEQGCYMMNQAVKQAWLIQDDKKFTYNQVNTIYHELCNRDQ